ncbi:MAG: ABC transporter substrate-binding protein [Candidatus Caldarchaeum sp.]|nr:ABC transporter substrate-binding protein [Candidatus Caldarchaeum sp.]MDW8360188.1 ABC transporter substrate-binding protein [Candidatus Caldarchaeum sp.]
MDRVVLGFNKFAFHWFFPEIVAINYGFFAENGLECELVGLQGGGAVEKSDLYVDAMRTGRTDFYHCGEWVGVVRFLKNTAGRIAAQSKPAEGTLNSSFTIFVRGDAGISSPRDLAGKTIAVEAGTGSFYAARADLEHYLRADEIRLVSVSEPHERLKALMEGRVDAANLLGPWARVAARIGLKPVLTTRRDNPTLLFVADRLSDDVVARLVKSLNKAIERINANPAAFNSLYLKYVMEVAEMGGLNGSWLEGLESETVVDRWSPWEPYQYSRLAHVSNWMLERGLIARMPGEEAVRSSFW